MRSLIPALLSAGGLIFATCLTAQTPTAKELAGELRASRLDGTSYIRLRLEVNGGDSIQIQSKQRHTLAGSEMIYQILFPKERKGESVLLKTSGRGAPSGNVFIPPDTEKTVNASQMKQKLFGGALSYEDVITDFFAWPHQTLLGQDEIGRANCCILESKPQEGESSSYSSVKSWIDTRRKVPLRVEKYDSKGGLVVRIETTNVEKDDLGRFLPASLEVKRSDGESSVLEGSRIRHGVNLTDADFTAQALRDLSVPR